MTEPAALAFDDLSAPSRSGEVLIAPPLAAWPAMIERNRALRRRQLPKLLKRIAGSSPADSGARCAVVRTDEPPLIVTGHQPEFFHPGVWAKNVAAACAARRVGGRTLFVAVDHDTPDGLSLKWPNRAGDRLESGALELPWGRRGLTFEQQPPRGAAEWRAIFNGLPGELREDARTGMRTFLAAFMQDDEAGDRAAAPSPGGPDTHEQPSALPAHSSDYVRRWARGVAELDRAIGIESPDVTTLAALSTEPRAPAATWGAFAAFLLTHADEAAAAYNDALRAYRRAKGLTAAGRPVPDLVVTGDRIETPLWAWRSDGARQRVYVAADAASAAADGAVRVFAGADEIGLLSRDGAGDRAVSPDATLHGWRIRPRALMLTCYLRLFVADLFVHGLGGAKYDAMTDGFIRRLFDVQPPEYACVTATLRLNLPARPVSADELFAARRAERDAVYNPQRAAGFTPPSGAEDIDRLRLLLHERAAAIGESERLRRESPRAHGGRRQVFERIRALSAQVAVMSPGLAGRAAAAIEALHARQASAAVAGSREWFCGLHPADALLQLARKIYAE